MLAKKPHKWTIYLPGYVTLPAESPAVPEQCPRSIVQSLYWFQGPFQTENYLPDRGELIQNVSVGFYPPYKHPLPPSLLPAVGDLWLVLTSPSDSRTALPADEFKHLTKAASFELSHCDAVLERVIRPHNGADSQTHPENVYTCHVPHNSLSHTCSDSNRGLSEL